MPPSGSGGATARQGPHSPVQGSGDGAPKKKKSRGRSTAQKTATAALKRAVEEAEQSRKSIHENDEDQLRNSSVSTTKIQSGVQEVVEGQIDSENADQSGSTHASETKPEPDEEPKAENKPEVEQNTRNGLEPESDENPISEQEPESGQKKGSLKKTDSGTKIETNKKSEPERLRRLSAQAQVFQPTSTTSPTAATPRSSTFARNNYAGDNAYAQIDPSQLPAEQRKPFNISPELPLGWVRRFDSDKKKYLYINFYTQETQWEEPKTEVRKEIPASEVENSEEPETTESTEPEVEEPSTESESDNTSLANTDGGATKSQDKSKRNNKNLPMDANGITPAKLNPVEVHHLVRSSTPSRHIPAACLEPNTENDSSKATRKDVPPDTNFIPNPMVTFLVDEVGSLTCQLCEETVMTLSNPTCKLTDTQPALMPCGHVAGSRCLHVWLGTGRSACPFCGFSLRHAKCGHLRAPLVLNRETILDVPKTVPEGGAFAGYCRACRLENLEVNEVMRARALKAKVLEARAALEEDGRPEAEEALKKAVRELEDLSFTNREKRLGHLLILW
ncbi:hypothetical protein LQW54_006225 [Pestalotiopsis sp. IQ-011]